MSGVRGAELKRCGDERDERAIVTIRTLTVEFVDVRDFKGIFV